MKNIHKINQNIYITSDEKIKKRDWCLDTIDKVMFRVTEEDILTMELDGLPSNFKKIILTTDQDLIKDGVQAIDDEFLEWFIKNPSCGYIHLGFRSNKNNEGKSIKQWYPIIPKEESKQDTVGKQFYETADMTISVVRPKQETLEEALTAEEFFRNKIKENIEWEGEITLWKVPLNAELSMRWAKEYSDYVIKWQAERMYSEEEVLAFGKSCFYKGFEKAEKDDVNCYTAFREEIGSLVEQFKNK